MQGRSRSFFILYFFVFIFCHFTCPARPDRDGNNVRQSLMGWKVSRHFLSNRLNNPFGLLFLSYCFLLLPTSLPSSFDVHGV